MVIFKEIVTPSDKYFTDAINIYREAFESNPEIYLDPKYFSQTHGRASKDMEWHFSVLIDQETAVGMAAFALTVFGGYGGYVAIKGEFRHQGYGTILLKNIMEALVEDSRQKGWDIHFLFAEYEENNRMLWESKGFFTLPLNYFQPPLSDAGKWIPMNLGVIPLAGKDNISGEEILDFATFLYSKIYRERGYSKKQPYVVLKKSCENLNIHLIDSNLSE